MADLTDALTWDDPSQAFRPSLNDLGGAQARNDGETPPPKDGTHLCAEMVNQWQKQMAALARMSPSARLTISFVGGDPFIEFIQTAAANLTSADFGLEDNGDGDTIIFWTSTKLPAPTCHPEGTVNDSAADAIGCELIANYPAAGQTAVRVTTKVVGILADARFTVSIN